MNIFGLNISKRSKDNVQVVSNESCATSLIFGNKFEGSATSLSAFYSALELISNSIAILPIVIKRDNEIDKNHHLNFLFKDMLISKYNFMKMMINDVILYGNAYAYIERGTDGTPLNLIYCEHGSTTTIYNKSNQDIFYQIPFLRKGNIESINVIHLYKDSNNGIEGRSLITYANQIIKLSQATDKAASKYYSSGCALQGALTIKGARKNAKEQARQAFQETHGDRGSGLVILDDDMSYTPISSNANDSQMLEARTFNVQEIARFFNINPILLGDKDGASYASIELANIEFVTHTLMPYIVMIEEEFNRKLVKPSESNIRIDIDEKFLMMRGDMHTTSEYLTKLTSGGIITINEAREQLGLTAVEGGDEIIMPYTKIEDNKLTNTNDEDGNKGVQE